MSTTSQQSPTPLADKILNTKHEDMKETQEIIAKLTRECKDLTLDEYTSIFEKLLTNPDNVLKNKSNDTSIEHLLSNYEVRTEEDILNVIESNVAMFMRDETNKIISLVLDDENFPNNISNNALKSVFPKITNYLKCSILNNSVMSRANKCASMRMSIKNIYNSTDNIHNRHSMKFASLFKYVNNENTEIKNNKEVGFAIGLRSSVIAIMFGLKKDVVDSNDELYNVLQTNFKTLMSDNYTKIVRDIVLKYEDDEDKITDLECLRLRTMTELLLVKAIPFCMDIMYPCLKSLQIV